jgi:hypothetical protein
VDASLPSESSNLSAPSVPAPPAYRDRSTGLTVFGAIEIVLGAIAFLFIPMLLLGALIARKAGAGMPTGSYVQNVVSYTLAGIVLITLGLGSIRARRWAWALNVILSWAWLVVGVLSTVMITAILPATFLAAMKAAAGNGPSPTPLSRGVLAVILTLIIAMCAIFLVVLPSIFVAFYRKPDVEETCRHRDPVERWTDRCPLPVLAVSLIFAGGSIRYFLMSFTMPLFPLFGRYLTGAPAAGALLLMAGLDTVLSFSLYRMRLSAWWSAIAVLLVGLASAALTFQRADLLQAYSKMGLSGEQLRVMSASPVLRSGVYLYWGLGFSIIFLGFMLWIKRYFMGAAQAAQSPQQ